MENRKAIIQRDNIRLARCISELEEQLLALERSQCEITEDVKESIRISRELRDQLKATLDTLVELNQRADDQISP